MYCTKCGNLIENQKFCSNCGNKNTNEFNKIKNLSLISAILHFMLAILFAYPGLILFFVFAGLIEYGTQGGSGLLI